MYSINGCTIGIVGLGRIGLAVAKRLQPFGVSKFLYSGHTKKSGAAEVAADFVTFDNLLRESDFVIACCSTNSAQANNTNSASIYLFTTIPMTTLPSHFSIGYSFKT
jgi:glyoxylate/hydroxypyruvate reductase